MENSIECGLEVLIRSGEEVEIPDTLGKVKEDPGYEELNLKRLLANPGNCKIYQVVKLAGFGDNSQYFSQVFKSYTGISPSDYMKQATNLDAA